MLSRLTHLNTTWMVVCTCIKESLIIIFMWMRRSLWLDTQNLNAVEVRLLMAPQALSSGAEPAITRPAAAALDEHELRRLEPYSFWTFDCIRYPAMELCNMWFNKLRKTITVIWLSWIQCSPNHHQRATPAQANPQQPALEFHASTGRVTHYIVKPFTLPRFTACVLGSEHPPFAWT